MSQPDGTVMQIAYVVEDLELALEYWLKKTKAGPFLVLRSLECLDPRYRGVPTDVDLDIALGFSGNVCIELIQQNCKSPSVYRELLDSKGGGFHHWALFAESFDEEVARYQQEGHVLAFSGAVAIGGRFAYMDTVAELGGMIELIEATPGVRELFANLENSAREWDGSDPVRYMN
jgi:hypothetical protein